MIDIIDGKLSIQHDGTEEGIAHKLVAAGVPKDTIVLGFKSVERRKLQILQFLSLHNPRFRAR